MTGPSTKPPKIGTSEMLADNLGWSATRIKMDKTEPLNTSLDISCATGGMKYHNLLISLYIRPWESNEDYPRDVIMAFPRPFHYEGRKKRWSHLLIVQYKWLTATHPTTAYNRYKRTSMTLCFQELLSSLKFPVEDNFCGLQLIELILQKKKQLSYAQTAQR